MENQTQDTKIGSPKYWQTIEQWRNDAEFRKIAEQEFRSSPLSEGAPGEGGWARREFLKLMGASMALTSFGCVRRPAEKIVPYAKKPSEIVEGIPNYYSSSWADGSEGFGIVVKTREGRPIKVEGNPDHPINKGGMSARAHAHILSLYDPDRLPGAVRNLLNEARTNRDTVAAKYDTADVAIADQLKKGGVAVLTGSILSPSLKSALNDFKSAFNAKTYVWEPMGAEVMRKGQELSYGQSVVPRFRFDKAKFVLSVGADFLGTYVAPTENSRTFAMTRKPGPNMSKLVVVEPLLTLTGANADVRLRVRPSQLADVLLGVLHELVNVKKVTRYAGDANVSSILKAYANISAEIGFKEGSLAALAEELYEARGQSIVIAGEDLRAQVAANLLNSALGNDGVTIDYAQAPYTGFQGSTQDLQTLIADIESGRVKTLIIHGVNPVYALPAESKFVEALRKVEMAIYTGSHMDETARNCEYVIPDHHPLESWGDLEAQRGVYSVQQPTIRPLGNTRAFGESLLTWMKAAGRNVRTTSWYEYVRATAANRIGAGDAKWNELLQKGVVVSGNREGTSGTRSVSGNAISILKKADKPSADLELVLYPTVGLYDGTLANVPWLQEFPDPVTKICWDNYLTVSPKVAAARKLSEGQVVKLTVGEKVIEVPVHIQPGQHDAALGLAVGYGRVGAGQVADKVGVNAYALANFTKNGVQMIGLTATISPTATRVKLANVAGNNSMEGRQIVVEATLEQFKQKPDANIHRHKVFSAWSGHKYEGHKWGMTIDLSVCNGCSACMIACQSENNIPVVGKRHVLNGREMHWIRVDRYHVGDDTNPDTVFQPIPCMHCDNAPCETVCPVLATVHSSEGTNDMVYNRCVGTRYCSNNCPYKVRRFNWFNYVKEVKSPMHMALNPEVTVRARGVMEKCTFCIHKIQAGKAKAKLEGRAVRDGEITTACQDSCPTGAIVFGDVNDPESRVSKSLKDARSYQLLEELNTQPAVKYQSKIRNTHALKGGGHGGHA